jgi:hypothetical protein
MRPARVWWRCRGGRRVTLEVKPLLLDLRTPFGTSHSTTSQRLNALVRFSIIEGTHKAEEEGDREEDAEAEEESSAPRSVTVGLAEVGLPPKKAGVYEADCRDVRRFAVRVVGPALAARLGARCRAWGCDDDDRRDEADDDDDDADVVATVQKQQEALAAEEEKELSSAHVDVLEGLPAWCLPDVRRASAAAAAAAATAATATADDGTTAAGDNADTPRGEEEDDDVEATLLAALEALDVASAHLWSRAAARAGVEVAVLDAWAKLVHKPLRSFVGFDARGDAAASDAAADAAAAS